MHTLPPAGSITAIYNLLRMPVPAATKSPKPSLQPMQAIGSQTATVTLSTPANDPMHPAIDPDAVVIDTPTVPARSLLDVWQAAAQSADPEGAKRALGQSILNTRASAQAAGNTRRVALLDGMVAEVEAAEQAAKSPPADAAPKVFDSLADMLNSGPTVQFGTSDGSAQPLPQTKRGPDIDMKKVQAEADRKAKENAAKKAEHTSKPKIDEESKEILRYISEDFAMLVKAGSVVAYHIESGDELGKDGFKQYCAKHYGDLILIDHDKDGNETRVRASAGDIWWVWDDPMRRVVRRIVMEPTSLPESDDNPEVFNRWHVLKGTMAEPNYNATTDDIGILLRHLLYLSDNDAVGVAFFLNWLAWMYLHPGAKLPHAILFYSKMGRVGKSVLFHLLRPLFGPAMVGTCNGSALGKAFDDVIEHKRILFINEMARSDKADGYERFKNMISEEFVTFEGKGRAAKQVRNTTHFIVTTNHADALPLMQGDGRVLVLSCTADRQSDTYYEELIAWINGPGPAALAGVLLKWAFPAGWKPHAPVPQTAAAKAMQAAARDELEVLIADLVEAGTAPCDKDIIIAAELCAQLVTLHSNILTKKPSWTAVGRALKAIGAEYCEKRIERQGKSERLKYYVIRDKEKWANATPKQRGDHLNTGARLFAIQQPDDHLKAEASDHE